MFYKIINNIVRLFCVSTLKWISTRFHLEAKVFTFRRFCGCRMGSLKGSIFRQMWVQSCDQMSEFFIFLVFLQDGLTEGDDLPADVGSESRPDVPLLHLFRRLHRRQGRNHPRHRQEVRPLLPLRMCMFPSLVTMSPSLILDQCTTILPNSAYCCVRWIPFTTCNLCTKICSFQLEFLA